MLLSVALIGNAQELPVYNGEVLERDGLYYKPFTNEPLTAKVEIYFSNGQLMSEITYVKGKPEGLEQWWHDNGQLWYQYMYVNGKKEGLYRGWDENGKLRSSRHYVNGKLHGLLQEWEETGEVMQESTYVNGKRDGGERWYPEISSEMDLWDFCYKAGEVTDMSYCTEGKQP